MTSCPSCGWSQTKYELERSLREYAFLGLLLLILLLAAAWLFGREAGLVLVLCLLAATTACILIVKYRWSSCAHNLLSGRYQIAYLVMMDTSSTSTKEPDFERATRFLTAEATHPVSLGASSFLGVRDVSPIVEFVHLWPRDAVAIEKNLRALMAYIAKFPNESRPFISDANQLLQILKTPHYGGETLRLEERWTIYRATIERLGNESVQAGLQAAWASIEAAESKTEPEPHSQAGPYEPYCSDREEMERYEWELQAAKNEEYDRQNEERRRTDERLAAKEQHEATMKAHADQQAQWQRDCSRAENGHVP